MKGLYFGKLCCVKDILEALNGKEKAYNWLVTDYEFALVKYPKEIPDGFNYGDYAFLDGEKFAEIFKEGFQTIWGAFAAFSKDVKLEDILQYPFPNGMEGRAHVFEKDFRITNPLAEIEIDVWDGTYTTVILKDEALYVQLKNEIADCEDLEAFNERLKK